MRALWALTALMIGCEPAFEVDADTAFDTGGFTLEQRATGGQAPGAAVTAEQPLSTFPLDGAMPYEGIEPPIPTGVPFAVQTRLVHGDTWRLDVGIRAGLAAAQARDIGVRLAFNPQAVSRYQLRGALGTGYGIEVQRVPSLAPGSLRGATFDLEPAGRHTGAQPTHRGFLGTVTLSWTENGLPHEEIVVLGAP